MFFVAFIEAASIELKIFLEATIELEDFWAALAHDACPCPRSGTTDDGRSVVDDGERSAASIAGEQDHHGRPQRHLVATADSEAVAANRTLHPGSERPSARLGLSQSAKHSRHHTCPQRAQTPTIVYSWLDRRVQGEIPR